jgi:RNA polymerase sigma-70 factor (ECF subfamily)
MRKRSTLKLGVYNTPSDTSTSFPDTCDGNRSMPNSSEVSDELNRAAEGDDAAWQRVVSTHHERLRRMVVVRLDPRLASRVDPDDILQDVYLDASRQLGDYLHEPQVPFFLWLRLLTGHWIGRAHRHHLGTQSRSVIRDRSIDGAMPNASSIILAAQLLGREERPSEAAQRTERAARIQETLEEMDVIDREVLSLRHFEQLSRAESAAVLGISDAAASKRYIRALARLKCLMIDEFSDLENS